MHVNLGCGYLGTMTSDEMQAAAAASAGRAAAAASDAAAAAGRAAAEAQAKAQADAMARASTRASGSYYPDPVSPVDPLLVPLALAVAAYLAFK